MMFVVETLLDSCAAMTTSIVSLDNVYSVKMTFAEQSLSWKNFHKEGKQRTLTSVNAYVFSRIPYVKM